MATKESTEIQLIGVLAQVISVEYKARELNKALLFRGTSEIQLYKNVDQEIFTTIIGSTINNKSLEAISKNYKEDLDNGYSISFGNTLFAGIIKDWTACAYNYFLNYSQSYILFINKRDYVEHQLSNLFLITPLAPIVALRSKGEWFHPRSKAAIPLRNRKGNQMKPILGFELGDSDIDFIDPVGIVTTVRDPLLHAQLFSDYLAENMIIINKPKRHQSSGKNFFTDAEQIVYDKAMEERSQMFKANQKQASKYYKAIKTLEPFAVQASWKFREQQDIKKKLLKK